MADWMPGAKEAKVRAEAVNKRRMAAAALVTDLNTELEDFKLALELEAGEYQPADAAKREPTGSRGRHCQHAAFVLAIRRFSLLRPASPSRQWPPLAVRGLG